MGGCTKMTAISVCGHQGFAGFDNRLGRVGVSPGTPCKRKGAELSGTVKTITNNEEVSAKPM